MRYESNPKHSDPWQRGRRGAQCPSDVNADVAACLLQTSELEGTKRYAVFEGRAFCAQAHAEDVWHGYPIGWVAVPARIRKMWVGTNAVRRHDIKRHWD